LTAIQCLIASDMHSVTECCPGSGRPVALCTPAGPHSLPSEIVTFKAVRPISSSTVVKLGKVVPVSRVPADPALISTADQPHPARATRVQKALDTECADAVSEHCTASGSRVCNSSSSKTVKQKDRTGCGVGVDAQHSRTAGPRGSAGYCRSHARCR
jgi:hypothetical protein